MPKDITIDDYLRIRRQLARTRADRWASLSVLAVLVRQERHKTGEWPPSLMQTERIARAMTPEERCDPTELASSRRNDLASQSGVRPQQVERLIQHFSRVRQVARSYRKAGHWGRVQMLMRCDPLISWVWRHFSFGRLGQVGKS